MIAAEQARALRRLMLVCGGLAATLAAHQVCSDGLHLTGRAPFAWGSLAALAVIGRPRARPLWRRWSAHGLVARLLAVELALHALLTLAPWVLGVVPHHATGLIGPVTVAAHGAAALVLALVLILGQRGLDLMHRVVRRIRRAARGGRAPAPPRTVPLTGSRARRRPALGPPRQPRTTTGVVVTARPAGIRRACHRFQEERRCMHDARCAAC